MNNYNRGVHWTFTDSDDSTRSWKLSRGRLVIGRKTPCEILVSDELVSGVHATLTVENGRAFVCDEHSTNGTSLNGTKLTPGKRMSVSHGDSVRIGASTLSCQCHAPSYSKKGVGLLIGRDPASDIYLPSPGVSWHHARLESRGKSTELEDLGSTNGTFVNGRRASKTVLREGDVVGVGQHRLSFVAETLTPEEKSSFGVDAIGIRQGAPSSDRILLDNVSFHVPPNQLAAVVGPSGSGKSTFLNALTGFRLPIKGAVYFNGVSYYPNLEWLRSGLGYVPQDDVIPVDLSVKRVLWHVAKLRLPPDTTDAEIEKLILGTLNELGLLHRQNNVVKTLSGGERKRVNVAVELLSQPKIMFLDEPTSGLDPGMEKQLFSVLRGLCHSGRTVIMATHAVDGIAQCDLVLFLASGQTIFCGKPNEALQFFGVESFAAIYQEILSDKHKSLEWHRRFLASPYYDAHIRQPLALLKAKVRTTGEEQRPTALTNRDTTSAFRQWWLLTLRYWEIVRADRRAFIFLLLQAPVIAMLLILLFKSNAFATAASSDPNAPISSAPKLLFLLIMSAIWCGTCNAVREIVKEGAIYRRERLVNLRILPYLMSKTCVLSVLLAIQTLALWGLTALRVDYRLNLAGHLGLIGWIFGAGFVAMAQGLLVSACVKSSDQANGILPVLLLPQVMLSGLLVKFEEMGSGVSSLANFMVGRWAFGGSCATTALASKYKAVNPALDIPQVFNTDQSTAFIALALLFGAFTAATGLLLRLKDSR